MPTDVLPTCKACGYVVFGDGDKQCACHLTAKPRQPVPAWRVITRCWVILGRAAEELDRASLATGEAHNRRMAEVQRHLRLLRDELAEVLR